MTQRDPYRRVETATSQLIVLMAVTTLLIVSMLACAVLISAR